MIHTLSFKSDDATVYLNNTYQLHDTITLSTFILVREQPFDKQTYAQNIFNYAGQC